MQKTGCFARIAAMLVTAAMLVSMCSCAVLADVFTPAHSEQESEPEKVFGEYDMTIGRLTESLNEERKKANEAEAIDPYQFLPDYESEDFLAAEFTPEEVERMLAEPEGYTDRITAEQAMEDVEVLFRILRTSYGGYTYFGGDEAFNAAKEELLRRLQTGFESGISVSAFNTMLISALSFIEDDHFWIGSTGIDIAEKWTYMDKKETVFREDENGYYAVFEEEAGEEAEPAEGSAEENTEELPEQPAQEQRWYLNKADEDWLRLTIADSGELVYGLFALNEMYKASSLQSEFVLTDSSGEQMIYQPEWKMMTSAAGSQSNIYERYDKDGVPVVRLSSFSFDEDQFEAANDYLNDVMYLRTSKVIVVDLRGNSGGYSNFPTMWLENLTGYYIHTGVGSAGYTSALNAAAAEAGNQYYYDHFVDLDYYEGYEEELSQMEIPEQGDIDIDEQDRGFYSLKNRTIFVLFNKYTSSTGELALMQFRNMSNTVLVGTNSSGCLLVGNINSDAVPWLPNSGLPVQYGMNLMLFDDMQGFDSHGVLPDVIVESGTAVSDVVRCWNYYN